MKTKFLFTLSLFLIVCNCFGQITFQKVIHAPQGSGAYCVEQTKDGGYIITGYSGILGSTNNNVCLIKTDAQGDTLWTKTFGGGTFVNNGYYVLQTSDSGYIVAGTISYFGTDAALYVIKTDASGDSLWTRVYSGGYGEAGYYIQQTNDSGYIITGSTESFGAGGYDVYLLKINADGDVLWTKTYGGANTEEAECVKQTSDSGYILCGYTYSFGAGSSDVYLIKTNASGDTMWTKTYGSTYDEYGFSVEQTLDGGYIIAGYTSSFNVNVFNAYLIKTDAYGDTTWTKTYGGNDDDEAYDVRQTADSGYIICGYTQSFGAGGYDAYLIKIKSTGDTLWTKAYGGNDDEGGFSARQTADGGYIMTGNSFSFFAGTDSSNIYLIKTDGNGNSGCHQSYTKTVIGSTTTQVANTQTMVSSGGIAVYTPVAIGNAGKENSLCLATGINEARISNTITLYPNPTTDQLTISGNWQASKTLQLTVYNIAGERIYSEAINSLSRTCGINCKLFSSGIYFITVAEEKEQWVGRFVKE